jgi:hypothetical protein
MAAVSSPADSIGNGNAAPNDGPRDLFLHLLAIVALYLGVFELLDMLFRFVEISFPEPSNPDWSSPLDSIRFAVATLIIAFPVYVWAARFIVSDVANNPRKISLWTCRCPFYLTIFLAAVTSIVDLIWLLYYFLEDELTIPFALKVAAVLIVTGVVGIYYFLEVRQPPERFRTTARRFVYPACALVASCTIAGFIVSGPPMRKWFARYDDARIADLKVVQERVLDYWRAKKALPDSYSALINFDPKVTLPNVPGTEVPYDYEVSGSHMFNLCANFRLTSPGYARHGWGEGYIQGWGWDNHAGRCCFQRDVDSLPPGKVPQAAPPT